MLNFAEDEKLIQSISRLGDTVAGLAAKMENKAKSAAKAKQNSVISAILAKLESAIGALSAKVEASDSGTGGDQTGGAGPMAGGVAGTGGAGGAAPVVVGGPKPDVVSPQAPPPPPSPPPSSPEQEKMQKAMEDLAEKLQEVSDKIESQKAAGGAEVKMSPELTASQQRLGDQLSELAESVGKLIGEMQSIKDVARMNKAALEAASGASKTPLGKAAKMVEQAQISDSLNLQNSNSQKVNQVLNAVKDAATAAGLTASVLGKVISNGGAASAQQGTLPAGAVAGGPATGQQGAAGGYVPNMGQAAAVANLLTMLGVAGNTNGLIGSGKGNSALSNSFNIADMAGGSGLNVAGGPFAAGIGTLGLLPAALGGAAGGGGTAVGGGNAGGGSSGGSARQSAMMGAAGALGALNAMSNTGAGGGAIGSSSAGRGNDLAGMQGIAASVNNGIINAKSRESVELPDISTAFENLLGTLSRRDLKSGKHDRQQITNSIRQKLMELENRGKEAARNPTPSLLASLRQEFIRTLEKVAPYSSRIREFINMNKGNANTLQPRNEMPLLQQSGILRKGKSNVDYTSLRPQTSQLQADQKDSTKSSRGSGKLEQKITKTNDPRNVGKLMQLMAYLKGGHQGAIPFKQSKFNTLFHVYDIFTFHFIFNCIILRHKVHYVNLVSL